MSSKEKRKTAVAHPAAGSLEAAGWLESKVSEREFKEYQTYMRDAMNAMNKLVMEFAARQEKVEERLAEIEKDFELEDLSNSSETFGGNEYEEDEDEDEDEERAREDSIISSSSSESSDDNSDSDREKAFNYEQRFRRYNEEPQQGPHSIPYD